jgi:hypothetical protein
MDQSAGIREYLHRHNVGTAYDISVVGNSQATLW